MNQRTRASRQYLLPHGSYTTNCSAFTIRLSLRSLESTCNVVDGRFGDNSCLTIWSYAGFCGVTESFSLYFSGDWKRRFQACEAERSLYGGTILRKLHHLSVVLLRSFNVACSIEMSVSCAQIL